MHAFKRSSPSSDSSTGKHVKPVAKSVISDSGSVTVDATEALRQTEVRDQLRAVRRIREASRHYALAR